MCILNANSFIHVCIPDVYLSIYTNIYPRCIFIYVYKYISYGWSKWCSLEYIHIIYAYSFVRKYIPYVYSYIYKYTHTTDGGNWTYNNYDCQNSTSFHRSPRNFQISIHGSSKKIKRFFTGVNRSPRHSKEWPGKLANLNIQIF